MPQQRFLTFPVEPAAPTDDRRRPSTAALTHILSTAAAAADPQLAADVQACKKWRTDYVDLVARTTLAGAGGRASASSLARAGLDAMRHTLVLAAEPDQFDAEHDVVLADATWSEATSLESAVYAGSASRITELVVPYQGEQLRGARLKNQVRGWSAKGLVEPSFADAIERVVDHPEWLALDGRRVAMIGVGAEMGPLAPLLQWGAEVVGIDLPEPRIWDRIREMVNQGAGRLIAPSTSPGQVGIDLRRNVDEAHAWLVEVSRDRPLTLGTYAYADSAAHVQVTAAADMLITKMLSERSDLSLAWLATPTDAYLAPADAVTEAHVAWEKRGWAGIAQKPVQLISRGKLYEPSYPNITEDGRGLADVLVPQQGPNYAMAKRLQRWRGLLSEAEGHRVSFNIAPATWTRSVTKNRVLAAAYAGAGTFGIKIFEPETTRVLMAALLVHDLHTEPVRDHPEDLFSDQAAHGGLWRAAYDPRSALPMAALGGLPGLALRSLMRR